MSAKGGVRPGAHVGPYCGLFVVVFAPVPVLPGAEGCHLARAVPLSSRGALLQQGLVARRLMWDDEQRKVERRGRRLGTRGPSGEAILDSRVGVQVRAADAVRVQVRAADAHGLRVDAHGLLVVDQPLEVMYAGQSLACVVRHTLFHTSSFVRESL